MLSQAAAFTSTKAPAADGFGFGPLVATQQILRNVKANLSKSRRGNNFDCCGHMFSASRRSGGEAKLGANGDLTVTAGRAAQMTRCRYFLKLTIKQYKTHIDSPNIPESDWKLPKASLLTHARHTDVISPLMEPRQPTKLPFSFHSRHINPFLITVMCFSYYVRASQVKRESKALRGPEASRPPESMIG